MDEINLDFLKTPPKQSQSQTTERCVTPFLYNELNVNFCKKKGKSKIFQMAQNIAKVDELLQENDKLRNQNNELQQQLKDFQTTAQQVQELYSKEKQEHNAVKISLDKLQREYQQMDVDLTNKNMVNEQIKARLAEYEGRPIHFNNLVVKYVKIMNKLESEDKLKYTTDKDLVEKLREYCNDMKLKIPPANSPKKYKSRQNKIKTEEAFVQCNLLTGTSAPSKYECIQCLNKPKMQDQHIQCSSTKRDQASQYISTMITRQTNTERIKQKHVSTMFPEPQKIPAIDDILNVYAKWSNIRSVSPLLESPTRREGAEDVKKSFKNCGTCTMLCNIRRKIDYLPPNNSTSNIKQEIVTPSASPTPTSNAHLNINRITRVNSLTDNNSNHMCSSILNMFNATTNSALGQLSSNAFNELWQIFGKMLLSLLQTSNAGIANSNITQNTAINQQQFLDWLLELYMSSQPQNTSTAQTQTMLESESNVATSPLCFNDSTMLSANVVRPHAQKTQPANTNTEGDESNQVLRTETDRDKHQQCHQGNTSTSSLSSTIYNSNPILETYSQDSNSMDIEVQQIASNNIEKQQQQQQQNNISKLKKREILDKIQDLMPELKLTKKKRKALKRLLKKPNKYKKSYECEEIGETDVTNKDKLTTNQKENNEIQLSEGHEKEDLTTDHNESEGEETIETAVDFLKTFAMANENNNISYNEMESNNWGDNTTLLQVETPEKEFNFTKPATNVLITSKTNKQKKRKISKNHLNSKTKIINKYKLLFGDTDSEFEQQEPKTLKTVIQNESNTSEYSNLENSEDNTNCTNELVEQSTACREQASLDSKTNSSQIISYNETCHLTLRNNDIEHQSSLPRITTPVFESSCSTDETEEQHSYFIPELPTPFLKSLESKYLFETLKTNKSFRGFEEDSGNKSICRETDLNDIEKDLEISSDEESEEMESKICDKSKEKFKERKYCLSSISDNFQPNEETKNRRSTDYKSDFQKSTDNTFTSNSNKNIRNSSNCCINSKQNQQSPIVSICAKDAENHLESRASILEDKNLSKTNLNKTHFPNKNSNIPHEKKYPINNEQQEQQSITAKNNNLEKEFKLNTKNGSKDIGLIIEDNKNSHFNSHTKNSTDSEQEQQPTIDVPTTNVAVSNESSFPIKKLSNTEKLLQQQQPPFAANIGNSLENDLELRTTKTAQQIGRIFEVNQKSKPLLNDNNSSNKCRDSQKQEFSTHLQKDFKLYTSTITQENCSFNVEISPKNISPTKTIKDHNLEKHLEEETSLNITNLNNNNNTKHFSSSPDADAATDIEKDFELSTDNESLISEMDYNDLNKSTTMREEKSKNSNEIQDTNESNQYNETSSLEIPDFSNRIENTTSIEKDERNLNKTTNETNSFVNESKTEENSLCWSVISISDSSSSKEESISKVNSFESKQEDIKEPKVFKLSSLKLLDLNINNRRNTEVVNKQVSENVTKQQNDLLNTTRPTISSNHNDSLQDQHDFSDNDLMIDVDEAKTESLNDSTNSSNISTLLDSTLFNEVLTESVNPIVDELLQEEDENLMKTSLPSEVKRKRGRKRKSECIAGAAEVLQPCKRSQRLQAKQKIMEESLNLSKTPIELGKYTKNNRNLTNTTAKSKIKKEMKSKSSEESEENVNKFKMGFFKETLAPEEIEEDLRNLKRLAEDEKTETEGRLKENQKTFIVSKAQEGENKEQEHANNLNKEKPKETIESHNDNVYGDKPTKNLTFTYSAQSPPTVNESFERYDNCPDKSMKPTSFNCTYYYNDSPQSPPSATTTDSETDSHAVVIPAERLPQFMPKQNNITIFDNLINSYRYENQKHVMGALNTKERLRQDNILTQLNKHLTLFCYTEMELDGDCTSTRLINKLLSICSDYDLIEKSIIAITQNAEGSNFPIKDLPSIIQEMPPRHLAKSLQRLFPLLRNIVTKNSNFCLGLMDKIESLLFNSKQMESLSLQANLNLTQLYLMASKIQESIQMSKHPARLFIAKCLYFYLQKSSIMIHEVLMWYPTVLPYREDKTYDRSDALISVLQQILMSTKYDMENAELFGKPLLSKLRYEYHFEPFKPQLEEVIAVLVEKLKNSKFYNISLAFGLMCKRTGILRTQTIVLSQHLLPLANEYYSLALKTEEYDKRVAVLLEIISMIVKPFPIETNMQIYFKEFARFLNTFERRPVIQEAALCSILRLQRFDMVYCYKLLCHFKPTFVLNSHTQAMLNTFLYRRPLTFWNNLKSQNPINLN
ncbi:uncharacterized protein Ice1 [Cochliomyia hominivorax]